MSERETGFRRYVTGPNGEVVPLIEAPSVGSKTEEEFLRMRPSEMLQDYLERTTTRPDAYVMVRWT